MRFFDGPRPRIFGHRGAAGVVPENTLESFARGLADGADYVETDAHVTRDGVAVLLHDPDVSRTTDGDGLVADYSLGALQLLDAGYRFEHNGEFPFRAKGLRVPTFEEALARFPETRFNVELKTADPRLLDAVLEALDRYDARGRVLLAGEESAALDAVRARAPWALTSFSAKDVWEFLQGLTDEDYRPPGRALQVPVRFGELDVITETTVRRAHQLGVEVHAWTINDPDEQRALWALGVDGFVTDTPAVAARTRARL